VPNGVGPQSGPYQPPIERAAECGTSTRTRPTTEWFRSLHTRRTAPPLDVLNLVGTDVLRRIDGNWRIVHEHLSHTPDRSA
jgi:SnoaL-like domain